MTSFRPVLIRRILRSSFGSRSRATFVARVASLVRFCWCGAFELKECKIVSVRRVAMFVGSRSRYATLHSHSLPFSKQTHPSQIISQLLGHINLMTKNGSIIIANDVSLDSFQVFDSNKSFFDFTLEKWNDGVVRYNEEGQTTRTTSTYCTTESNERAYHFVDDREQRVPDHKK